MLPLFPPLPFIRDGRHVSVDTLLVPWFLCLLDVSLVSPLPCSPIPAAQTCVTEPLRLALLCAHARRVPPVFSLMRRRVSPSPSTRTEISRVAPFHPPISSARRDGRTDWESLGEPWCRLGVMPWCHALALAPRAPAPSHPHPRETHLCTCRHVNRRLPLRTNGMARLSIGFSS